MSRACDAAWPHRTAGAVAATAAVLITGGIGTFSPRPLPTGTAFEGRGLRYFVPCLRELTGLDVLIVGGGDSAFDWALSLEPLAWSVTLVHRRNRFRAHEATVARVLASPVRVLVPYEVSRVYGNGCVTGAEVVDTRTNGRLTLTVQGIVATLGFTADLGPLTRWPLELRRGHVLVDSRMRTSLPRVTLSTTRARCGSSSARRRLR